MSYVNLEVTLLCFVYLTGTTWLQEIVQLIHSDCNFQYVKGYKLDDRFPYLEFSYPGVKEVAMTRGPRLIKSHLPYCLLPKSVHNNKPKVGRRFYIICSCYLIEVLTTNLTDHLKWCLVQTKGWKLCNYKPQHHLGQSENLIFCVLLALAHAMLYVTRFPPFFRALDVISSVLSIRQL